MKLLRAVCRDALLTHLIFGLVVAELAMREIYHRTSGEGSRQVVTVLLWGLCSLWLVAANRGAGRRERVWPSRVAWLCACAVAVEVMLGIAWRQWVGNRFGTGASVALAIAAAGTLCWALRSSPTNWKRWRDATTAALCLYIASQPVLAVCLAPSLRWPPLIAGDRGTATLLLLLDEMDASVGPVLVQALEKEGLPTQFRAVGSVGANTIQSVPAMFTQRDFSHPKPCGMAALCSGSNVLDFGRIHASRDDVDVVGFYHPYCAMQGLRSCARVVVSPVLLDGERWACALWRRIGWPADRDAARCNAAYHGTWQRVQRETLEAFWAAPFWQRGGVMFAHIPLPHPPGPNAAKSIDEQYADNVQRAAALLRRAVVQMRASGLKPRVLVFSDHPLRREQWCGEGAPFHRLGACPAGGRAQEQAVPLIAAGDGAPSLESVTDNGSPFEIAAHWR